MSKRLLITSRAWFAVVAMSTAMVGAALTQSVAASAALAPDLGGNDATMALSVNPTSAPIGGTIVFTATTGNASAVPQTGAQVTFTVPTGVLSITSVVGSGWTCDTVGGTITCTNMTVVPADSDFPSIVLTTKRIAHGDATVTASVGTLQGQIDSVSANNTDSATVTEVTPTPSAGVEGVSTPQPGPGVLAVTGYNPWPAIGIAVALIVGGSLILVRFRRRA